MRLSILALVPAALALATPGHMKRQDVGSAAQQIAAGCDAARAAVDALAAQSFGNAAIAIQESAAKVDQNCAGLQEVLGLLAAAGPDSFEEADGAAGDRFGGI